MTPRLVARASDLDFSGVLNELDDELTDSGVVTRKEGNAGSRTVELVWLNITLFAYLHLAAIYGLWLMLTSAQWATCLFGKSKSFNSFHIF